MYSSNQIIDVTSTFQDLSHTLDFIVGLYDKSMFVRREGRVNMAFMQSIDGTIAIGTGSMEPSKRLQSTGHPTPKGWTDFQFKYEPEMLSLFLKQWAYSQPRPKCEDTDGSIELGVRIRTPNQLKFKFLPTLECAMFNAIMIVTPYYNVYHK
mgnify:FL=1